MKHQKPQATMHQMREVEEEQRKGYDPEVSSLLSR